MLALVVAGALPAVLVAARALGPGPPPKPPVSPGARPLRSAELQRALSAAGVLEHLRELQAIADRHGGNRAAGAPGGEASIDYVAGRLRAAGYSVRLQPVRFPFFDERSPPSLERLRPERRYSGAGELRTLRFSGGGRVTARVQPVDLGRSPATASDSGCERADFAGFPRGRVALVQRGTCTFRQKARNAQRAGAAAVLVFNDGRPGRRRAFLGSLGARGLRVPALAVSFDAGRELASSAGAPVRLAVDVVSATRSTRNVLSELAGGDPRRTVMVGAHLDSVPEGPGINDNGSGAATVLEMAEQLASLGPPRGGRVRFAWWGAEEVGLVGSRRYVRGLSGGERADIAAYLNLDMVGSPNPGRFVYEADLVGRRAGRRLRDGSAAIEDVLSRHFAAHGLATRPTHVGGASDHAPFVRAGVPVGGLFSGAAEVKRAGPARAFGGRAGRPYDRCYHRACDRLDAVSRRSLEELGDATAHAVVTLAERGGPRGARSRAARAGGAVRP